MFTILGKGEGMRYTITTAAQALGVTREQFVHYLETSGEDQIVQEILDNDGELTELDYPVPSSLVDAVLQEHIGYTRDEVYSVSELAEELGVTPAIIYYRIKQGTIPAKVIGQSPVHRTYIPKERVANLVRAYRKNQVQEAIKQADKLIREMKPLSHKTQTAIREYIHAKLDGKAVRFVTPDEEVIVLNEEEE